MLLLIVVLFNNCLFYDVRVWLINCIVMFLIDYFYFCDYNVFKKNLCYLELFWNFMVIRKLYI